MNMRLYYNDYIFSSTFNQNYQKSQHHLSLKGLQPSTIDIDAYFRAIRRIDDHFNYRIYDLKDK